MKKRLLSLVSAMAMIFCLVMYLPGVEIKAEATQAETLYNVAYKELGSTNYSKYYNGNYNQWCADFVSWCAITAGIPNSVIYRTSSCTTMKNQIVKNSGNKVIHLWNSGYKPVMGDLIFFGEENDLSHVGIVEKSDNKGVYYIDGNYTGTSQRSVHYSYRAWTRTDVWGFISPNYTSSPSVPPSNVKLTISPNNYWYDLGDTISLTPSAKNAQEYYIAVYNDSNKLVKELWTKGDPMKFKGSELGVGTYHTWMTAVNDSYHHENGVDSNHIDFTIVGKPSYTDIKVSKARYSLDETVQVTVSAVCTKNQTIGINRGSERVITDKNAGTVYTVSAKTLGAGSYSSYYTLHNGSGYTDTKKVNFLIYSAKPSTAKVTVSKSSIGVNENVTFKFSSDTATEYTIGIDDENGTRIDTTKKTTDSYTRKFDKCGDYTCYIVAANKYGKITSQKISFSVTHTYTDTIVKPTCTEKGYTLHKCTKCGKTYKDKYTNATGHTFGSWTVTAQATCAAEGKKTRKCSVCGKTESETIAELTTHKFSSWTVTKQPTCTAVGTESRTCSVCKTKETRDIKAKGHSYTTKTVAPTCIAKGYTLHTCSVCSDNYKDSYKDAIGHSYKSTITKAATCTENGTKTYTCEKCKASYTEVIKATGHKLTSTVVAPTDKAQGYTLHKCKNCDYSYKDNYTDMKPHTYTSKVTEAATCTVDGVRTYTCTECGSIYTEVIPKTGHSYKSSVIEPTCTERGYTLHKCSKCGDTYKSDFVNEKGHSYKVASVTEPGCEEQGVITYSCESCGDTYSVSSPANGHSYITNIVAPTCSTSGYTEHTCSVCGSSYKDNYLSATGHSFGAWKTKTAATCTEPGEEERSCTLCKNAETRTVSPTDHKYVTDTVAPTCTKSGYTTYTCALCGDEYTDDITPAKDHTYVTERKEATCTSDGYITKKCLVCGDMDISVIEAKGHDYRAVIVDPTFDSEGYTEYTCSDCGNSYKAEYIDRLKHAISDCTVKLSYSAYTYSGGPVEIAKYLTVKDGSKTLVKDVDYTLSYENNDQVGCNTADVIITGKGDYVGTLTKSFTIKPEKLAAPTLTSENSAIIVNWKKVTADAVGYQVIYDKIADFDTSATGHTADYHTTTVTDLNTLTKTLSAYTKPGETWYVKVRAFITSDGTTSGTRYGTFSSAKKIVVKGNVSTASIPYASYTYTGSAIKPAVTVKDTKGTKLTTSDYTVDYKNNTKVGTATITITGKGNYQGTITKTFVIKPKAGTLTLTAGKASFKASWTKNTTATGYQITYSKDKNFASGVYNYTVSKNTTTSANFSSKPKSGETWYVKCRPYITVNGTKYYGSYSAVKTVKTK